MTRVGINPARGKHSDYHPARITVAMVTYLPSLAGYFANRLEVIRLVFDSLFANTSLPYDLMVFDNGSCASLTDYLLELKASDQIDYLILSKQNIGKIGAFQVLLNAVPGEIVAYHDDDILFYPGWMEACLDILENIPQAGMVSGQPVRDTGRHARKSLELTAQQYQVGTDSQNDAPTMTNPNGQKILVPGMTVSYERIIPDAWEADWALSTGRDPQKYVPETQDELDLVFRLPKPNGSVLTAVGCATHFQFLARKELILKALPSEWSGKLMGEMKELDGAVDDMGALRLATAQRFTRHLGNTLSEEVIQEAVQMSLRSIDGGSPFHKPSSAKNARKKSVILRVPGAWRILSAIYQKLFDVLYK
jgi:hypothetical protein